MKEIFSMTGFGRAQKEDDLFQVVVEAKSVNHRFKDVRVKMPSHLNLLELDIKKKIEKLFRRGSFEIYINLKKNAQRQNVVELDYAKIASFIQSFQSALDESLQGKIQINPIDFIRSDFSKEEEDHQERLHSLVLGACDLSLSELSQSRLEEGSKVVKVLQRHLEEFCEEFDTVRKNKSTYQADIREKLSVKLAQEKNLEVDQHRFNQEVIHYLEKLDIDEEVNRLEIHIKKLHELLSSSGEIGRKIDFLVQELNRETNTIGSKSASSVISQSVVEMKTHLEKIREQALNLE